MKITITKNEAAFDLTAAWRIIGQMLAKPDSVIGLSTGKTTLGMHKLVSEIYNRYPFDTSKVTIFNVDELTNIDRENPASCYTMIQEQIVKPLQIREYNFIMPPTYSDDFEAECRLFEIRLKERGGIDLQMLGIGWNGHIGINQPGTPFEQNTWISDLDEKLDERLHREQNLPPEHKIGGFTLGPKNLMHAKKIILVAKGAEKASVIKDALFGPVTPAMPASILQLHPNCEILLDTEAASGILDLI